MGMPRKFVNRLQFEEDWDSRLYFADDVTRCRFIRAIFLEFDKFLSTHSYSIRPNGIYSIGNIIQNADGYGVVSGDGLVFVSISNKQIGQVRTPADKLLMRGTRVGATLSLTIEFYRDHNDIIHFTEIGSGRVNVTYTQKNLQNSKEPAPKIRARTADEIRQDKAKRQAIQKAKEQEALFRRYLFMTPPPRLSDLVGTPVRIKPLLTTLFAALPKMLVSASPTQQDNQQQQSSSSPSVTSKFKGCIIS